MRPDVAVSIEYPHHFALLASVTALLLLTHRWLPVLAAVPSLGLYGMVHSSLVAAAVRPPQFSWQKILFVAVASGIAMLSIAIARLASQVVATLPGTPQPVALLTLSSALGAVGYGLLIRRVWIRDLSRPALAWITLSCVTATLVALALAFRLHGVGGWWFAITWWWAFSLALCVQGRGYRLEVPPIWPS